MVELVEGKAHNVIKRDGRVEPYNAAKLHKVILWACKNKKAFAKELMLGTNVKIHNNIHITKLLDEVIETAASKTSVIVPEWDDVAKRLLLQKYYKLVWGIKRDQYPQYLDVIQKGLKYKVYNSQILSQFSEDELVELGNYVKPERDFKFTFGGLELFMQKYSARYTKTKFLELPQHTYMRVAIQLHYTDANRMETIKKKYDMLSNHQIAVATPIMLNALSSTFNATSCVLIQVDDDTESIMEVARSSAVYSKHASGLGIDVSRIRSIGSSIGVDGISSGEIPFIKLYESVVSAFNQKCYSEDTEILTENGWKRFNELQNERVAQYTYEGEGKGFIELVEYTDFYEYELNNQPMFHFYMKNGRYVDLMVSQNHRMVKLITPSNKLRIQYAKDIEFSSDNHLIVSGGNCNVNKPLSWWDKFLIAYQADGGRWKAVNGSISGYYSYYFKFSKLRKIQRLQMILDALIEEGYPIKYKTRINKNGQHPDVTIFDVKFPVDYGVLPKTLKWVDSFSYSEQEIDDFITEVCLWDGYLTPKTKMYQSINKLNTDKLQELAVLGNYRTQYRLSPKHKEHWADQHHLSFVKTSTIGSTSVGSKLVSNRGIRKEQILYTGKIYCVTVPSGLLVVRRNGKVAISGNSSRNGSAAIYFPWWHYEAPELMMLKDAGGKDEDRARKLKYSVKWNKVFTDKIMANEDVYLFDPKDTPELLETSGDEFAEYYEHYCNKQGIRKRKINSRELAFLFTKMRSDTGNYYWFSVDNANKYNMGSQFIPQGNLCCAEVLLPTKPLQLKKAELVQPFMQAKPTEIREYEGEIGICNLTSVNIKTWITFDHAQKQEFMYNLLVGFDNAIEYANYPVKAGETFNKLHRAIGVGVTNYHNTLASLGSKLTSNEAKKFTHEVMEDILFYVLSASSRLAIERGRYSYFKDSQWEKGRLPFELYELPSELNFPLQHDWEPLREAIRTNGVRFEYHMSIPPGATSSLVLNFTEGIEPIRALKTMREGTYTLPFLAPDIKKNREFYEFAWDIPSKTIIDLAAIRQKFLDQSQSLNLYYKNPDSAYDILNDIFYAESLGIKSLYYMNSQKAELQDDQCEGCAV